MSLKSLILILLLIPSIAISSPTEQEKIDFLLNQIQSSHGIFIRNGKEYKAKDAVKHLKFKLNRATSSFFFFSSDKKVSATEFIDKIASQSSSSGKPYLIKLKNKRPVKMKTWLDNKLNHYLKTIESRPVPTHHKAH